MYWLPAILIVPYFILILRIYRNLLKIVPFNITSPPVTFISVIIACRNSQDLIPALLENILSQDYPETLFEVIIVDDNSTDRTFETVSERMIPGKLIIVRNKGKGKKEAIRTGVDNSGGRLIITTDADCSMGKSWIRTIASFYENYSPDLIICPVKLESKKGFFSKFQELEYLGLQGITAGTAAGGSGVMCNGANLAFTRDAYLKHMKNLRFELPSGDDVFLLHSIKKDSGSRVMWLESFDAIVTTASSPALSLFLKQRKRWMSKWNAYDDGFTILTGIVVLMAVLLQLYAYVSVFFGIFLLWPLLAILVLKSIPDYLILRNTTRRYGKTTLMLRFLPSQLIYPLYVICVVLFSMVARADKG